jgi:hypothetical protein
LAIAARQLLEAPDHLREDAIDSAMGAAANQSVSGYVARQLCLRYASQFTLPYEEVLKKSARALRIMGILLCAVDDDLEHCECLNDLAEEVGTGILERTLTGALQEWSTR